MSNAENHYDIIIIGTGAGGGTLAYQLASTGKKILILERGTFLPREKANWDTVQVFLKDRYHTKEVWYDNRGKAIHPGVGYWVGGNTKVYGAALLRNREQDFEKVVHHDGVSPEWPLKYTDFDPYYTRAEKLYQVHGQSGQDLTEAQRSEEYPFPAVSHEPRMQEIHDSLVNKGLHPFPLPVGIKLNETNKLLSTCIRCNTCDGYPCLVDAKSDADINGGASSNGTLKRHLITEAKVLRLHTSASGREVTAVETEIAGELQRFSSDIVIVACGAINSAVLLLRSANEQHPKGLANSSDQVGRNFMKHCCEAIVGVTSKPNPTAFQKTLAVSDFYWGEKDFPYPMGFIQTLGKVNKEQVSAQAPPLSPGMALDQVARHSVDWWLQTEDLPNPNNRVRVEGDKVHLEYTPNNTAAFSRLVNRWIEVLKSIDCGHHIFPFSLYFRQTIALQAVGHQCGTCRFGEDPETSVLDINCRTHDVDNLYVVDGSFFPSSTAVNPTLTIIANAIRVADHLIERL